MSWQGTCGVPEVGLCVCVHQGSGHVAIIVKRVSSSGSRHCRQQGAVSVCACCSQQHKPAVVKKPPMYEHLPGGLWAKGTGQSAGGYESSWPSQNNSHAAVEGTGEINNALEGGRAGRMA